jgi:hypothetical protein
VPEPRLITSYLAALFARLPAGIVEELADGLAETYQDYLRHGLALDRAAEAAVAEFGDPDTIAVRRYGAPPRPQSPAAPALPPSTPS